MIGRRRDGARDRRRDAAHERGGGAAARSVALVALAVAAFAGCAKNDDPGGAEALLEKVRQADYHGWDRPPGWETRRASDGTHGDAVDIYVNDVVSAALVGPAITSWPLGSIVVKDVFANGTLDAYAIMEKRSDGWYWAELSAEGKALNSGHPSGCMGCHGTGADFVRAFGFPH